jgi:hypothetical protein
MYMAYSRGGEASGSDILTLVWVGIWFKLLDWFENGIGIVISEFLCLV